MKNVLEWIKDILIAVVIAALILVFLKPIMKTFLAGMGQTGLLSRKDSFC